jgi:bacteriocin-like protein
MKTLFANNETKKFDNFAFDILTTEELACIKGGKEEDTYIDPPTKVLIN